MEVPADAPAPEPDRPAWAGVVRPEALLLSCFLFLPDMRL